MILPLLFTLCQSLSGVYALPSADEIKRTIEFSQKGCEKISMTYFSPDDVYGPYEYLTDGEYRSFPNESNAVKAFWYNETGNLEHVTLYNQFHFKVHVQYEKLPDQNLRVITTTQQSNEPSETNSEIWRKLD